MVFCKWMLKNIFVGTIWWENGNLCARFLEEKDVDVVVGTEFEDLAEVDGGTKVQVGVVGGYGDFVVHLGFAIGFEWG